MQQTLSVDFDPLQAMYGAPYVFEDICLIYPATLRDIAQIGVDEFYRLLQHITIHPPTLSKELSEVSGYEFILRQSVDLDFYQTTKKAISFFLREDCLLMQEAQVFALGGGQGEEKFQVLSSDQFSVIQEVIRRQHFLESVLVDKRGTGSKKAQEILDRLARGRRTAASLKKQSADSEVTFADIVGSMAVALPGVSIANIWDFTYYAVYDQFHRFQMKEAYGENTRAALAGAKVPKEKLKGWIGPIKK